MWCKITRHKTSTLSHFTENTYNNYQNDLKKNKISVNRCRMNGKRLAKAYKYQDNYTETQSVETLRIISNYKESKWLETDANCYWKTHFVVVLVSFSLGCGLSPLARRLLIRPLKIRRPFTSERKKYFPIVTREADKLLFRSLAGNTSSTIALTTTTHHRRNYENAIRQLRYRNQGKKNRLGNWSQV